MNGSSDMTFSASSCREDWGIPPIPKKLTGPPMSPTVLPQYC